MAVIMNARAVPSFTAALAAISKGVVYKGFGLDADARGLVRKDRPEPTSAPRRDRVQVESTESQGRGGGVLLESQGSAQVEDRMQPRR